ncbi:MAG: putative serine/threonine-protein kinase Nek4 [Streblomastix strix]|uniref:Putative serine/threonine-protein kinase Nek4 n=1 Tax=Streblomastix strix TaxID=222440 RepID=A0A5J4WUM2_9EUKA|nr:MAG: putative serine/threonine-protein kinase Nek4 [Streblomastix strix]
MDLVSVCLSCHLEAMNIHQSANGVILSRHSSMSSFKDYRVIRQLPGGAQSKTYLVELRATRQQFIMKKVSYLEDVDRAKVDVEIELMRSLDSDFTVHLVCVFPLLDIELCMILQYCVRGDFRNLIDEFQQLPQSEKLMRGWEYTAQIARALDHLHSHNVMHRDLKPANILVNQDGTIRLGDFGLSREMNEDYYQTIAGTKVYMAPEVHLLKRMNKSSDIFSLGVIIFQLITGHHPYEADSEEAMIDKIKKNKVLELPDWEGALVERDRERIEKERALADIDRITEERNQERTEKERYKSERDQEKNRANIAEQEKQKEIQEKQKAQSERDYEKRRADTEHAEVIRLTSEITRLNQSFQSVPSSIITIPYQSIIPDPAHVIQQENKITLKSGIATVSFNPVSSSGIVRFGGFLKDHPYGNFIIGIAESSAVFGSNELPSSGENDKKTVRYYNFGDLQHIRRIIKGNSRIEENKTVAVEVNMNIIPRTLTFFYDNQEQPIYLENTNSSFTITEFENVQYSSAKGGIKGQRIVEWGKEWKK